MRKQCVYPEGKSDNAPYSPAVILGSLVFVSGQGPRDKKTGKIVEGFENQVVQAIENLKRTLEFCGSSLEKVLKVTLYLVDLDQFSVANAIYMKYFPLDAPARTCVQPSRLPNENQVEIDAIAYRASPTD